MFAPCLREDGCRAWPTQQPYVVTYSLYLHLISLAFVPSFSEYGMPQCVLNVQTFHDQRHLPEDGKRRAIVGLMWACAGVACMQFILAAAMMTRWKQLLEARKRKEQQGLQRLGLGGVELHSTAAAPPPPPRYPANTAGVFTPLLQPAGGNPYSAPPQPAGDNPPFATVGSGAAPLLGGYVNSTAVPPAGGRYTALPQQPTDVLVPPQQLAAV